VFLTDISIKVHPCSWIQQKKNYEQALHYNKTGSPLKLVGVKEQDSQLFINSTTSIIQVNATDLDFESKPTQDDATTSINNQPETIAANITLAEMQKLTRNQSPSHGSSNPRSVTTKARWPGRKSQRGLHH